MEQKVYIFGAHSRARTLSEYLTYLNSDVTIEAFLYDNEEQNPLKLGTIPVICLNDNVNLCLDNLVYIGTRGVYHVKIEKKLKEMGFKKICPVTFAMDLELRNKYLEKYYSSIGRKFFKIDKLSNKTCCFDKEKFARKKASIYVATSVQDQLLQQSYQLYQYEKVIQVGAALTQKRLERRDVTDNQGENISERNSQFCELTALYWIWKNAKEDIIGLEHYRRHFILPEDWLERMEENHVDVILPTPLYVAPCLEGNYKERHEADVWNYMMQCIKECDEEMYKDAVKFFGGNLYSPCNMFIMHKEVLDVLCTWLFPILFKVVKFIGDKEDRYQNRYPGFLSERLITFFLERNSAKYKIVFADKNFLT